MNKLLLHPHITLAALITCLASLGAMLGAQAVALAPLTQLPFHGAVKDHLLQIDGVLSMAAAVCVAAAAVGRSISQFIDSNGQPDPDAPVALKKAA